MQEPTPTTADQSTSADGIAAAAKKQPIKIDKGDYYLEKAEFSGNYEGLSAFIKQFKTLDGAVAHFTSLGKDANDIITALINRSIDTSMRFKARNTVKGETEQAIQINIEERKIANETLLISEDDADSFVPGARDITSKSGLMRALGDLKEEIVEAKKAGQADVVAAKGIEYKRYYAALVELQRKEDEAVMKMIG